MSLQHAILGFLNYKSLTGYDLKKIFDTSVRHFWAADQSQIYRTLNRLTERGLAEMEVVEQSERPDRKVYSITEDGKTALYQWLLSPIPPHTPHNAELVQLFFAGQLTDDEILAIFERSAKQVRTALTRYEEIPQQAEAYADYVESPREFFCWMLTLDAGYKSAQAHLSWLEGVIQRIRNNEIPPAKIN